MEEGAKGLRETIQELAVLFYFDDGLVASLRLKWLQREFNFLTDLFDWVGLCTNVWKTVSMARRPCYTRGNVLESEYTQQVTGVGPSYQERLQWRVK